MAETIRVPETAVAPALLLRPWAEGDIPALLAAHRDPLIRRGVRNPIISAGQAREVIGAQETARRAGTRFSFAVQIVEADGTAGEPVGGVSVRGLGGESGRGEVGYWTAPDARGRGIAPRALNAVCAWAFELPASRPLDGLELIHAVDNQASCRVAAKAGFALAAMLPPLPPQWPNDAHLHLRLAQPAGVNVR